MFKRSAFRDTTNSASPQPKWLVLRGRHNSDFVPSVFRRARSRSTDSVVLQSMSPGGTATKENDVIVVDDPDQWLKDMVAGVVKKETKELREQVSTLKKENKQLMKENKKLQEQVTKLEKRVSKLEEDNKQLKTLVGETIETELAKTKDALRLRSGKMDVEKRARLRSAAAEMENKIFWCKPLIED